MQIEEGKYYKTRDGRKVGPMGKPYASSTTDRMLVDCLGFPSRGIWWADGRSSTAYDTPEDLVSEWPTSPVVTEVVQKTRIVPGTYADGLVRVGEAEDDFVMVAVNHSEPLSPMTADDLDAAAAVLSALAKGLRDA